MQRAHALANISRLTGGDLYLDTFCIICPSPWRPWSPPGPQYSQTFIMFIFINWICIKWTKIRLKQCTTIQINGFSIQNAVFLQTIPPPLDPQSPLIPLKFSQSFIFIKWLCTKWKNHKQCIIYKRNGIFLQNAVFLQIGISLSTPTPQDGGERTLYNPPPLKKILPNINFMNWLFIKWKKITNNAQCTKEIVFSFWVLYFCQKVPSPLSGVPRPTYPPAKYSRIIFQPSRSLFYKIYNILYSSENHSTNHNF